MTWKKHATLLTCLLAFGAGADSVSPGDKAPPAETPRVRLVTDPSPPAPVRYALGKVKTVLQEKGLEPREATRLGTDLDTLWMVVGLPDGGGAASRLLRSGSEAPPQAPESLLIRKLSPKEGRGWLVTGADPRGLMYALLEVASRIGWATSAENPFSELQETRQQPAVSPRALSIYTMHRRHFEQRFFDDRYWERYLDLMASNRFNSFVLIFGYENGGYFAPAYPYFFDVEGFPQVRVVDFSPTDQDRYFQALKRLIRMVHERGMEFTVGLWDHIYRGGVQSGGMDIQPGQQIPGVVTGLTQENLVAYHQAALTRFLQLFPEVDAIQFRMHGESGLKREEMHDFWKSIYEIMLEHAPGMRFDARAKEFPDSLIDLAVEMGVKIRICTKYWAEQMGLPFHPTHINRQNQFDRRHGYADLLRYPKKYDLHWRLWNGGTTRVLLWGDPEYVRRFVKSTHLYEGQGFEVNEMLATKMASQPHDLEPFELLHPRYRYYDYEFERYWHFFQVFGRIGYDPGTPAETWDREFEKRFGPEAGPHLAAALHRASWVLPMINAYNFPYHRFPTTRGWPGKQRREDLPDYARADGSDTEQFLSMRDAARALVSGRPSAKIWPQQSSRWFRETAEEILVQVEKAENSAGQAKGKEFVSTVTDLKILAHLALYHSRRALAGLSWVLWEETGDLNALDDAIRQEEAAIQAWEKIVQAAGNVYAFNLRMGLDRAGLTGHWRDELEALRKGLEELRRLRKEASLEPEEEIPFIRHVPARKAPPGADLLLRATMGSRQPIRLARIAYRTTDPGPKGESQILPYRFLPLEQVAPEIYHGRIPGPQAGTRLAYFLEAVDEQGHWVTYPEQGWLKPIAVTVSGDDEPPQVEHTPVAEARANEPLTIRARVSDPSGVRWVRLRYRGVNQHYEYQALPMLPSGENDEYVAVVPAEHVSPRWDFMYYIEVMDEAANGKIYPDLYRQTPYVVVPLKRD